MKKAIRNFFLVLGIFLGGLQMVFAQTSLTVKGKVSTKGTTTDENGNYILTNVPSSGKLLFSFVGFKPQTVEVNKRTEIDITLEADDNSLNQVVVIGYGTQQKKDLTG